VRFVCEARSELAAATIRQHNYEVDVCPDGGLLAAILGLKPHLVINDLLDTDAAYVAALKTAGCRVVNFEDLGPGADHADLVVNALYDDDPGRPGHLAGPDYFCLRDEFVYGAERAVRPSVGRILVTFGGVDENNLTMRSIDVLVPVCRSRRIAIDVVVGPGFRYHAELDSAVRRHAYPELRVAAATSRISDYMLAADMAMTSGGRTVLELASLRVPTIVVCQNARELTHSFATPENGILNLGLHSAIGDDDLESAVVGLIDDARLRDRLREKLSRRDLTGGKRRVAKAIAALLEDG
jgi:spore coat polysaccharide biosynthesis predicted glycosyltransferase SpsG